MCFIVGLVLQVTHKIKFSYDIYDKTQQIVMTKLTTRSVLECAIWEAVKWLSVNYPLNRALNMINKLIVTLTIVLYILYSY
jgi:hypothetical protein